RLPWRPAPLRTRLPRQHPPAPDRLSTLVSTSAGAMTPPIFHAAGSSRSQRIVRAQLREIAEVAVSGPEHVHTVADADGGDPGSLPRMSRWSPVSAKNITCGSRCRAAIVVIPRLLSVGGR